MSKPRPITEKELAKLRAKVDAAWYRWMTKGSRSRDLSVLTDLLTQAKQGRKGALLFFRILVGRVRPESEEVATACKQAAAERDFFFFQNLSYSLKYPDPPDRPDRNQLPRHIRPSPAPPLRFYPEFQYGRMPPLVHFLLTRWDCARDGYPELFRFGQDALAEICRRMVPGARGLSPEAVRQYRRRLGLPVVRRCKLKIDQFPHS